MQIISKVLIGGLLVATSISAAIVASSMGNAADAAPHAISEQNFTIIHKTDGTWPLKGMVSVEPCSLRQCVDA